MAKKLMMNNYSDDVIVWDIDKKSDVPVSIKEMCQEYMIANNGIVIGSYSNNQLLEIDIEYIESNSDKPRFMLLSGRNFGGQIYRQGKNYLLANANSFVVPLLFPCKLKLELINDVFSIYINDVFIKEAPLYSSVNLPLNGVQLISEDIFVTGFRYKNFEE